MKKLKFLPFVLVVLIQLGCNKQDENSINANKVIESIKSMSKLGTTEYTLTKVIAGEDNQWYTIGSRKILFSCKAHLVAGIDASLIQFTDLDASAKKIKLTIPEVEMITFDIPPNEIKRMDVEVGIFRSNFTAKEVNDYEKFAESKILEQIKELDIKSESEKNAKLFLEKILRSAGFESIEITSTR